MKFAVCFLHYAEDVRDKNDIESILKSTFSTRLDTPKYSSEIFVEYVLLYDLWIACTTLDKEWLILFKEWITSHILVEKPKPQNLPTVNVITGAGYQDTTELREHLKKLINSTFTKSESIHIPYHNRTMDFLESSEESFQTLRQSILANKLQM